MLRLLPADALVSTGPVDHADWNYRPLLGPLQRRRFRLICSLWPEAPVRRVLEIGYGSGVFLPELAARCEQLDGIDIHPHAAAVAQQLERHGVSARLAVGSAESLPYDDASFDLLVAVSALEFVPDSQAAARELRRVLAPGGRLLVVTPGHSRLLDLGLKLLTGESAARDYGSRRERLLPALGACFTIERRRTFPPLVGAVLPLYTALRLR